MGEYNDLMLTVKSYVEYCWLNEADFELGDERQLEAPEVYDGADAIGALYKKIQDERWEAAGYEEGSATIEAPCAVVISYQGKDVEAELEEDYYEPAGLVKLWEKITSRRV